ncbi:MAG: ATP-binding cassette domain-containing protein [Acetivibrio ethanolgignens]
MESWISMLEIKDVTLGYHGKKQWNRVLEDFSFSMERGRFLSILGPSGCGKTTLLKGLSGVLPVRKGEILFEGSELSPGTISIGLIPQSYGLLPWKTVKENALFGVQLRDGKDFASKEAQYEKELTALAERLSIEKLLSRYPSSLSGGQAQRTALLRALLVRPLLLLMDEPFAALDAAASIEAAMLCLELWEEYRPTTVMVTHRLEDAMALATDILVMNQSGKISACYQNPWQGSYDCQEEEYFKMKRKLREAVLAAHGKGEEKP